MPFTFQHSQPKPQMCWQRELYRKAKRKEHSNIVCFFWCFFDMVWNVFISCRFTLHLSVLCQFFWNCPLCYSTRNHMLLGVSSHPTWEPFQNPHSKDELRRWTSNPQRNPTTIQTPQQLVSNFAPSENDHVRCSLSTYEMFCIQRCIKQDGFWCLSHPKHSAATKPESEQYI